MFIDFTPRKIKCLQTVSSPSSPWGIEDGLRFYFAVEVGFQTPDVMISGRKYPEPDVVNNHPIKAGETINLDNFLPQNRTSWQTKSFNVDEGNLVTIWLIGVNEGLPFFGGGGGSGSEVSTKIAQKGSELAIEKLSDAASEEALERSLSSGASSLIEPIPVIGALINAIIELAEFIDESTDCSGSAFIYKKEIIGRDLIAQLIQNRRETTLIFNQSQTLRTSDPSNPCLVPHYEVTLDINLRSIFTINHLQTASNVVPTPAVDFVPYFTFCAKKVNKQLTVWSAQRDFLIEFFPNFKFQLMPLVWKIEGIPLTKQQQTVKINLPVTIQPHQQSMLADVEISCEINLNQHLFLKTKGSDGSYQIRVEAFLPLQSLQPPFKIYQYILRVDGQEMYGDAGYQEYLECVSTKLFLISEKIKKTKYITNKKPFPGQPSKILTETTLNSDQLQVVEQFSTTYKNNISYDIREIEATLQSIVKLLDKF
ncbi:MAG: hypothetical protein V4629_02390 [Pseudomonadota bacterium]